MRILEAFSEGVNAFVNFDKPPIEYTILGAEFDPWTPADSLAIVKVMDFFLTFDGFAELGREIVANATGSEAFAREFMPFEEKFFGEETLTILSEAELKKSGLFIEEPYESRFKEVPKDRIHDILIEPTAQEA